MYAGHVTLDLLIMEKIASAMLAIMETEMNVLPVTSVVVNAQDPKLVNVLSVQIFLLF